MAWSAAIADTRLSEARSSKFIELAKYSARLTSPKAIQSTMTSTEPRWNDDCRRMNDEESPDDGFRYGTPGFGIRHSAFGIRHLMATPQWFARHWCASELLAVQSPPSVAGRLLQSVLRAECESGRRPAGW